MAQKFTHRFYFDLPTFDMLPKDSNGSYRKEFTHMAMNPSGSWSVYTEKPVKRKDFKFTGWCYKSSGKSSADYLQVVRLLNSNNEIEDCPKDVFKDYSSAYERDSSGQGKSLLMTEIVYGKDHPKPDYDIKFKYYFDSEGDAVWSSVKPDGSDCEAVHAYGKQKLRAALHRDGALILLSRNVMGSGTSYDDSKGYTAVNDAPILRFIGSWEDQCYSISYENERFYQDAVKSEEHNVFGDLFSAEFYDFKLFDNLFSLSLSDDKGSKEIEVFEHTPTTVKINKPDINQSPYRNTYVSCSSSGAWTFSSEKPVPVGYPMNEWMSITYQVDDSRPDTQVLAAKVCPDYEAKVIANPSINLKNMLVFDIDSGIKALMDVESPVNTNTDKQYKWCVNSCGALSSSTDANPRLHSAFGVWTDYDKVIPYVKNWYDLNFSADQFNKI